MDDLEEVIDSGRHSDLPMLLVLEWFRAHGRDAKGRHDHFAGIGNAVEELASQLEEERAARLRLESEVAALRRTK